MFSVSFQNCEKATWKKETMSGKNCLMPPPPVRAWKLLKKQMLIQKMLQLCRIKSKHLLAENTVLREAMHLCGHNHVRAYKIRAQSVQPFEVYFKGCMVVELRI